MGARAAACELRLPPHPNIVRMYGLAWSVENAAVLMVMEACRAATLEVGTDGSGNAMGSMVSMELYVRANMRVGSYRMNVY